MSRLKDKHCSLLKKKCLIAGCAQYDERLDACAWNLLPFNVYKVANAIEKATPEAPLNQAPQTRYPGRR
ncbi:MAG: hypothetical protein K8S18_08110 [Desulfobacula sp.]|nr:hypothetical protein [Desulfobacula sp.]